MSDALLAAYLVVCLWVICEGYVRRAWAQSMATTARRCQVQGCGLRRYGIVSKGLDLLPVCVDHSEELTGLFGWAKVRSEEGARDV